MLYVIFDDEGRLMPGTVSDNPFLAWCKYLVYKNISYKDDEVQKIADNLMLRGAKCVSIEDERGRP